MRSTTLVMLVISALGLFTPILSQETDPCGVSGVPLTSHPDRPVYRSEFPMHDFDWRQDTWPVFALVRDKYRNNVLLSDIPRPTRDAFTQPSSALFESALMDPNKGWEFLVAENGIEVDSTEEYEASYVCFIFYNKYSGKIRPMYYYTYVTDKAITHYQWIVWATGDEVNRSIVYQTLDHLPVDSNLVTGKSYIYRYRLQPALAKDDRTWLANDYDVYYDPCSCTEFGYLNFQLDILSVRDTVINGYHGTVTNGPYWIADVMTAYPGRTILSRGQYGGRWAPFYDAPLGTWTLLRTPVVQMQVSSQIGHRNNDATVRVRLLVSDTLIQAVNPHVFDTPPNVQNDLAYLLTIYGDIEPREGLTRVNDTLYLTNSIEAQCATSSPQQAEFSCSGDFKIASVRLTIGPRLTPRNKLDSISIVQDVKFIPCRTSIVEQLRPHLDCDGIRQATALDVATVCESAHNAHYSTRSRFPDLPNIDTLTPSQFQAHVLVSPNPASGDVNVSFNTSVDESIESVYVVDMMGKRHDVTNQVYTSSSSIQVLLKTDALASGGYIIVIKSSWGVRSTQLTIVR